MREHPKKRVAAALVIRSLKRKNRQTATQLANVLETAGLSRRLVPTAVRLIRDLYGANALVTSGIGGKAPVYILDPQLDEGQVWSRQMTKRGLTEARHLQHVLSWLAEQFGNRGTVRRAGRHVRNAVEELEELYAELKN